MGRYSISQGIAGAGIGQVFSSSSVIYEHSRKLHAKRLQYERYKLILNTLN
jgi:hypothetical protein